LSFAESLALCIDGVSAGFQQRSVEVASSVGSYLNTLAGFRAFDAHGRVWHGRAGRVGNRAADASRNNGLCRSANREQTDDREDRCTANCNSKIEPHY